MKRKKSRRLGVSSQGAESAAGSCSARPRGHAALGQLLQAPPEDHVPVGEHRQRDAVR